MGEESGGIPERSYYMSEVNVCLGRGRGVGRY